MWEIGFKSGKIMQSEFCLLLIAIQKVVLVTKLEHPHHPPKKIQTDLLAHCKQSLYGQSSHSLGWSLCKPLWARALL